MTKIFISHATADDAIVDRIAVALNKAHIDTWIDHQHGLKPGDDWSLGIDKAINTCDCGLFVLSPASVKSDYCRAEWNRVLYLDKKLYVALTEHVPKEVRPARLGIIQPSDLTNDFDGGIDELIGAINGKSPEQYAARIEQTRSKRLWFLLVIPFLVVIIITIAILRNEVFTAKSIIPTSTPVAVVTGGDVFATIPTTSQGAFGLWTFATLVPAFSSKIVSYYVTQPMSVAIQFYEHGFMFWRSDNGDVYVFYDNGAVQYFSRPSIDSMAVNPNNETIPPNLVRPTGGFGKVWGNNPDVRDRLGWALKTEDDLMSALISSTDGSEVVITLPDNRTTLLNSSQESLATLESVLQVTQNAN